MQIKRFTTLLVLIWAAIGLPKPTKIQTILANKLQFGDVRTIIECFRGVGKSFVAAAFVCFLLLQDPQLKILVASQSQTMAIEFIRFVKRILESLPIFNHLVGDKSQTWSDTAFDVACKKPDKAPSVKAVGITGQMTGSRADVIIADDVETLANSLSVSSRLKIAEMVKEFEAILKPNGRIIFLGTPQLEDSLYNKLEERGYEVFIIPARYPNMEQCKSYGERLAPEIYNEVVCKPSLIGHTTEPERFTDLDLMARENSYGHSGFNLQYMLDTRLSDANRYPLKLKDLIVMDCDIDKAPVGVIWASNSELIHQDLPCIGINNDRFLKPFQIIGDYSDYSGAMMAIDPSGKGTDETTYAITKFLNGYVYLLAVGGFRNGYSEDVLEALAKLSAFYKVNNIQVEGNFGQGMFNKLFEPFLIKYHSCNLEEIHSSIQKEYRIIDKLEPVMNRHKLIVAKSVVENDKKLTEKMYSGEDAPKYQLFYQMTRMARIKKCLAHDDRIEVVSTAVGYWVERMNADVDRIRAEQESELRDVDYRRFMNAAMKQNPKYKRMMGGNTIDRELY
jgi:hypothetical protein